MATKAGDMHMSVFVSISPGILVTKSSLLEIFASKGKHSEKIFNISKKEPSNLHFHGNRWPLRLYLAAIICSFGHRGSFSSLMVD